VCSLGDSLLLFKAWSIYNQHPTVKTDMVSAVHMLEQMCMCVCVCERERERENLM